MKTRILTLMLTLLIVLSLFLSACAESEEDLEYVGEEVDQSYLNTLRKKAGFAEHNDSYDNGYNDGYEAGKDAALFEPDPDDLVDVKDIFEEYLYDLSNEEFLEYFSDFISDLSDDEILEFANDYSSESVYSQEELKNIFAYAFQKGYEYGKNDIMDDTAKYYINNYNFTKQEINIYDIDWNFADITVEVPTETTKAIEADAPHDGSVYIVNLTQNVCRNEMASITIKGKPNTEYSISVIYNSGPSKADGLETKLSDSDGFVSWTWKVGGKTAFGSYNIHIAGGGETYKTYFSVIEG